MEITDGQSWSNYIGPNRDNPQVCLTRPVFTPFPLKVAWSGISVITEKGGGGWLVKFYPFKKGVCGEKSINDAERGRTRSKQVLR